MKKQSPKTPLSDETLNSLVDREFPVVERAELLAQLQTNEEAKKSFCEINHIKDRVKTAYAEIPQPDHRVNKSLKPSYFSRVASIFFVALFLGILSLGLNSNTADQSTDNPLLDPSQRLVMLDPDGRGQKLSENSAEELRVIFHVSNSTNLDANELLDDIESLLKISMQNNQQVRVEVVAHASGLDLLRERLSTTKTRIASMAKTYPELTFVACLNTVERIQQEQGIIVKLIPDAQSIESGVAHVVKRQQQGWLYIQV